MRKPRLSKHSRKEAVLNLFSVSEFHNRRSLEKNKQSCFLPIENTLCFMDFMQIKMIFLLKKRVVLSFLVCSLYSYN